MISLQSLKKMIEQLKDECESYHSTAQFHEQSAARADMHYRALLSVADEEVHMHTMPKITMNIAKMLHIRVCLITVSLGKTLLYFEGCEQDAHAANSLFWQTCKLTRSQVA